jgi:hypothetical protein
VTVTVTPRCAIACCSCWARSSFTATAPSCRCRGIDPVALARLFDRQEGTILGLFNMFLGRRAAAALDLRDGRDALHLGVDHPCR